MIIKKKSETTATGITIVYDEKNVGHELAIANYPIGSHIFKKDDNWYFDTEHSPFSDETNQKILNDEAFYYETRDFLSYQDYLHMLATHPTDALQLYRKNPYCVLDYVDDDSTLRFSDVDSHVTLSRFELRLHEMKYAIASILTSNENGGHTWIDYDAFAKRLMNMLEKNRHPLPDVSHIKSYLNYYKHLFYYENNRVAFLETYRKEQFIHDKVQRMKARSSYTAFKSVPDAGLSDEQNQAVYQSITRGDISILTGGPGTGKTTTLRSLVSRFNQDYPSKNVVLLAPTGKASRRIKEVFQDLDITIATIHYFIGFGHRRTKKDLTRIKDADFIIIDETSMVGVNLFYDLLSSVDIENARILLVGDVNQLPSVEAGNILDDLIALGVPTCYLTQNFRSANCIHANAAAIIQGVPVLRTDLTFRFDAVDDAFINTALCSDDASVVLTPYRKEYNRSGEALPGNSSTINRIIHNYLYPGVAGFALGEKVIINTTNYKAKYVNGETGVVSYIGPEGLMIMTDDGEKRVQELQHVNMAHAITVHKSQGSEYDDISICVPKGCSTFFTRQMLYTAVTRAKKSVRIVGDMEEVKKVIMNNSKLEKRTFLGLFAKEGLS